MPKALLAEIRAAFSELAQPADAPGMEAYMKGIAPFFGVKAPARRALQQELFRLHASLPHDAWEELLRRLWDEPERELHYLAVDWLYHRRRSFAPDTITLLEAALTTKSWWDTVDTLSTQALGHWATAFPDAAAPAIRRFIASDNLWLNRAAIIHQLRYGPATDTALLTDAILPHLGSKAFFHQKAIGWALRQYARTAPDWVLDFVAAHPLAPLSRREALKHLG